MSPRRRPMLVHSAVALTLALALAGCGGSEEAEKTPSPSPSVATPSVQVPTGVSLTEAGTDLDFGAGATVPYRPNEKRGTVLRLTVRDVRKASMEDFAAYVLDDRAKKSTPYYVRVQVENVGTGDVGGTDIPLWAVDGANTLIHSSTFTNTFRACPSGPLPKRFGPTDSERTCLVYLVPDGGELTAVSFRPLQEFAPIQWRGEIGATKSAKESAKAAKKAGAKSKKGRTGS